ncbi:DUF721 domain-containing protein [Alcaligenaceae bacterium]|nr:DUF721 domain-containing protein [Alcaligenaceae bacterium]
MSNANHRGSHHSQLAPLALSWLDEDQHGSQVLATARHLLAVEQAIQRVLPTPLDLGCKVARIDRQQITLAVPSAAYASKLRQLGPRILANLKDNGWNLTEISVRVQGGLHKTQTKVTQRQVVPLDDQALAAFDTLRLSLEPGPLSDAISKLLSRHRNN